MISSIFDCCCKVKTRYILETSYVFYDHTTEQDDFPQQSVKSDLRFNDVLALYPNPSEPILTYHPITYNNGVLPPNEYKYIDYFHSSEYYCDDGVHNFYIRFERWFDSHFSFVEV